MLELLATTNHGGLSILHLYGVIWNILKRNRTDTAIHGLALAYSGIACYLHYRTLRSYQNDLERTEYAIEDTHARSETDAGEEEAKGFYTEEDYSKDFVTRIKREIEAITGVQALIGTGTDGRTPAPSIRECLDTGSAGRNKA